MLVRAIRNSSVQTLFRLDEDWQLFAISAGLAVKNSGSIGRTHDNTV